MSKKHQVVIAGAGGMGSAVGLLLRELGDFEVDLFLGDANGERARAAAAWIREGSLKPGEVHAFHLPLEGTSSELDEALSRADILLDCLPGREAPRMARLARRHDLHYANLTEHVEETEEIQEIAQGSARGFLLQTGLAPGYVNVLGHSLYQRFCREQGTDGADRLEMRVGALTTTARPPPRIPAPVRYGSSPPGASAGCSRRASCGATGRSACRLRCATSRCATARPCWVRRGPCSSPWRRWSCSP